jgi:integrase
MTPLSAPSPDPRRLPLADFLHETLADRPDTTADRKAKSATAIGHLQYFLHRRPVLDDLTSDVIQSLFVWLMANRVKVKEATAREYCSLLVRLGEAAVRRGLLEIAPSCPGISPVGCSQAFTSRDLERLLAAAAELPGTLGETAAHRWWPALILASLDTRLSASELLLLPGDAFDATAGTLAVGAAVYPLHPVTVDALAHLGDRRQKTSLLAWGAKARRPYDKLNWDFRKILKAAGLPDVRRSTLSRLQATADEFGNDVLSKLDQARIESQRQNLRARRLASEAAAAESPAEPVTGPRRRPRLPDIYAIDNRTPQCLRVFFRDVYVPAKLATGSARTVDQYTDTINLLRNFAACEVTLPQLSAEFLERFMAWYIQQAGKPVSCNKHLATIKAIWRHAMKKKLIPYSFEPQMVDKLRTPKRLVRTWSMPEFELLLKHAAQLDGDCYGVPARRLLPALILTAYYTAARIGAIVQLSSKALNLGSGWLNIDAELTKSQMEQHYRLPDVCLRAIQATDPTSRSMLFGGPLPRSTRDVDTRANHLRRYLHRAQAAAGLPCSGKHGWHNIRRLAATQIAKAVGPSVATELLGHSSPRLVYDHYLDRQQLGNNANDLLPRVDFTPPDA